MQDFTKITASHALCTITINILPEKLERAVCACNIHANANVQTLYVWTYSARSRKLHKKVIPYQYYILWYVEGAANIMICIQQITNQQQPTKKLNQTCAERQTPCVHKTLWRNVMSFVVRSHHIFEKLKRAVHCSALHRLDLRVIENGNKFGESCFSSNRQIKAISLHCTQQEHFVFLTIAKKMVRTVTIEKINHFVHFNATAHFG